MPEANDKAWPPRSSTAGLGAMDPIIAALREQKSLRVLGAEGSFRGLLLARAATDADADGPVLYLAPDDSTARSVAADVSFFLGGSRRGGRGEPDRLIEIVPEIDTSPFGDVSPDPRTVAARLSSLYRLGDTSGDRPRLIVASVRSFLRRVIPPAAYDQLCCLWGKGTELGREEAVEALLRAGYRRSDVVEDPGTFAVRGGVIDVFVPLGRFPVRIELFGDEIDRMRTFDPQSQRSLREIEECIVHPVRETVATTAESMRARVLLLADAVDAPSSKSRQVVDNLERGVDFFGIEGLVPVFHDDMVPLWSYLPPSTRWYVDEPDALVELAQRVTEELRRQRERACAERAIVSPLEELQILPEELAMRLSEAPVVATRLDLYDPAATDDRGVVRIELDRNLRLRAELEAARGRKGGELLRPVVDHIRNLDEGIDGPWNVILVAPNMAHAERLTGLLRGYGLSPEPPSASDEGPVDLAPPIDGHTRVKVIAGSLSEGFASARDRLLLLSEAEIFGKITRRQPARRRRVGLGSLAQLRVGDYVVHVLHGIGCYAGLVKLALGGVPGDYVLVEYAGTDKLYLPVYRLGEIERYAAADAKPPKVDRLGGATFATKTRKVKKEVRQMAEELLQIYAQRQAMDGHAFPEPDEMYAQFEAMFPFEETPDQEEAILSTHEDLGRPQPLDRLICGDVGFGKTEVALRAAFRVATSGKQVAVLAPTTVLVQQHFLTFRDRMSHFAVNVACLNRFIDAKERRRVLQGIRDRSVDVVVGTHRLLSRDVHFHDLGLVVIDEEQRFGVAQKERFKKLKTEVDVLTLTATPIPRTLHMSLLGIREISLIMTPPVDRLAVRTFLTRAGDGVIEEGIRKELARGGQVFYVVPRIRGIEEHARRVRELVPEARVAVAHGKMPAEMLERTMLDFVEHRTDVLVSTTIIESGLDIPRANTMFIARADAHGLAQLYQLRGRIGRSKHRAYCYLMVSSLSKLKPDARHRLEAIQRHSELGSGFNVASQDLEIRGAGDMLGARQSGYIQAIGFEAYTRILEEAVAELRGEPIVREADPEIAFDVPAFIPDSHVTDTGQRLDLYRRLSAANGKEEVEEVMEEIRDRFGEPPVEVVHLGHIMVCKTYGRRLRALALELKGRRFSVRLGPDTPLPAEVAAGLRDATDGYLRLVGGDRIATTVPTVLADDRSEQLEACQQALAALSTYVRVSTPS